MKRLLLLAALIVFGTLRANAQLVLPISAAGGVQAPIDANGWKNFKVTLTQNVTAFQFTGIPTPAQANVTVIFSQNGVGGFTVNYISFQAPSGQVISISNGCAPSTAANAVTVCLFEFDATTSTWIGVPQGGGGGGGSGFAQKPAAADAIQFVTAEGNDSNDGLSWGTAKLHIDKALEALPGGDGTTTAGSGTVYYTNNVQPCAASASYGIMLMGPSDPNYASPPTCWIKVNNVAGQSINIVGVPKASSSGANITTSTSTNRNQPAIWLSATQEDIHIDHLNTQNFLGRGVVVGECSNNVRTGTCQVSKAYFNYVSANLDLVAGVGPDWDVTGTSFWIYIFNSFGEGSLGVNGSASNLTPAFLFDGAGLILMEDIHASGGAGVKFINVPPADGTTINGLYLEGDGGSDNPGVWITNTNGTPFAFTGIGCADGSMVAVQVDQGNPTDTFVAAAQGSGSVGNVKGPMNILSQYNGNNAEFVLDPYVNSEVGFYGPTGRVLGQIDQARSQLVPQPVRYTNLVPASGSWTPGANITITSGVAGSPDGGSNAIRISDSGAQSAATVYQNLQTFTTGDWIIYAGWVRSPDAAFTGGQGPLQIGFSTGSCVATFNPPLGSSAPVQNLPATATNWQWEYTAGKVTTGGSCTLFLNVRADSTHRTDVYGLVGNYITNGTWDDQTVLNYVSNLSSYPSTCIVGNACDSAGRTPVLPVASNPRFVQVGIGPNGTPIMAEQQQQVNNQTGTTYTPQSSDFANIIYRTNAAAMTDTMPDANSAGFQVGFDTNECNGNGPMGTALTVNRTTSSQFLINGTAAVNSFVVYPGQCAYIYQSASAGTNWNVSGLFSSSSNTFTATTNCSGQQNCVQWIDDDTTDNCSAATTAWLAAINTTPSPYHLVEVYIKGGGGKAFLFKTCGLAFLVAHEVFNQAALDFQETSPLANCIQDGVSGATSYTSVVGGIAAGIDWYWHGGSLRGCTNATTAGMESMAWVAHGYLDHMLMNQFGPAGNTAGLCTLSSFKADINAEMHVSGVNWSDTRANTCAFSNQEDCGSSGTCNVGNLGGQSTLHFSDSTIAQSSTVNCGSVGHAEGGSHSTLDNVSIFGFDVPVLLAQQNSSIGAGGWLIHGGTYDAAGCTANSVSADIQMGHNGSGIVQGPATIIGADFLGGVTHASNLLAIAGNSTDTITGITITGNTAYNTGTNPNVIPTALVCATSTTYPYCYTYGNEGYSGLAGVQNGWIEVERHSGRLAGFAPATQTANLGSTSVLGGNVLQTINAKIRCLVDIQTQATTSSTLPTCTISWTDAVTSTTQTVQVTPTLGASATVGCNGTAVTNPPVGTSCVGIISAALLAGHPINVSTSGYASTGATPMGYLVAVSVNPE